MRSIQLIKHIKRMEKAMKIQKRIMDIKEEQDCPFTTLKTQQKGLKRFKFLISKKLLVWKKSFYVNEQLPEYYWTNQLYEEFQVEDLLEQLSLFRRKLHEKTRIYQLQDSATLKLQILKQFLKEAALDIKITNCQPTSPKTVKKKTNIKLPIENRIQVVEGIKSQAIQTFDVRFNSMQQEPDQREQFCNQLIVDLQKISNFETGHNQFII